METVQLNMEQLKALKYEAARGRPYAERISAVLAIRLLSTQERMFNAFSVLDEVDYLEGLRLSSRTKPESQFRREPLKGLWHKHFFSAPHLLKNIQIRWGLGGGGNEDLEAVLQEYLAQGGALLDQAVHRIVIGGFEERERRGLTGDWLLYRKHGGQNYYLDVATHEEGREPDSLLEKLRGGSAAEFPFAFRSRDES